MNTLYLSLSQLSTSIHVATFKKTCHVWSWLPLVVRNQSWNQQPLVDISNRSWFATSRCICNGSWCQLIALSILTLFFQTTLVYNCEEDPFFLDFLKHISMEYCLENISFVTIFLITSWLLSQNEGQFFSIATYLHLLER